MTDELVKIILDPGLEPGAADVFLEFICYSGGPLPEDLLPLVKVCISILQNSFCFLSVLIIFLEGLVLYLALVENNRPYAYPSVAFPRI